MEKEGLIRALRFIDSQGIVIREIVTDRHPSIRKYMREERPNTYHTLDVWHTAKGD